MTSVSQLSLKCSCTFLLQKLKGRSVQTTASAPQVLIVVLRGTIPFTGVARIQKGMFYRLSRPELIDFAEQHEFNRAARPLELKEQLRTALARNVVLLGPRLSTLSVFVKCRP